jgi:hypothetical protein
MSAVHNPQLEVVASEEAEAERMSDSELLNNLIAMGVNSCTRSYDATQKRLKETFVEMELCKIAPTWDLLNNEIKIEVVNTHSDEFKAWISGERHE